MLQGVWRSSLLGRHAARPSSWRPIPPFSVRCAADPTRRSAICALGLRAPGG